VNRLKFGTARLVAIQSKTDGTVREEKYDIDTGLVISRGAEQGVPVDGLDLSREHLVLTTDGADIYIEDLSVSGRSRVPLYWFFQFYAGVLGGGEPYWIAPALHLCQFMNAGKM
jgi:hypothetical protein